MYLEKIKIVDVEKFIVNKKKVYFKKDNKIFKNEELYLILEKDFFGNFDVFEDLIIIHNYRTSLSEIYLNKNLVKNFEGWFNYLCNDVFLFLNKKDFYVYELNEINYSETKKGFNLSGFKFKDYYITISEILIIYNYSTSEKLWQLALSSLGKFQTEFAGEKNYEVRQFVGVYKDVLWVFLNSQEFIGLDINSGEIIHWLKGVKKENISGEIDEYLDEKDIYVFFDTNYLIDTKAKKIIGLKADRYYEIDLDSEFIEPKMFGLWTKMQNVGINKNDISSRNIVVDNNLYFYNHNDLKFAIFDIDTKEIIYVSDKLTQDESKRHQIKDFQVANDKVYVLDSTGDLYIFEKES